MKRPSFQFYPADWRNNAKLRRCSWAARGVWIELMGLMHDSDEYGVLRWNLKQIAQAIGAPIKLLKELVECGVLYGAESGECEPMIYTPRSARKAGDPVCLMPAQQGPVWYSPRMVRDEYVRTKRGESTRFGEGGEPPKPRTSRSPKRPIGDDIGEAPHRPQGDGSTSSSTSTTSVPNGTSVDARQRFEMHEEWQPDELNLKTQCRMQMVAPELLTDELVLGFVGYWLNRDTADNQGGWCQRLAKWAKRQAVTDAAAGNASAPAPDWTEGGVIL
nr:DnaT-like ssDNA-binding domain-containing protein [uncultured Pseudomonas sp.]